MDKGTFVDPTKTTFVEYLRKWHEHNVVPHRRPETARVYQSMIEKHVAASPVGAMPLQKVRASDLEHLYATVTLAPRSVTVLHAVISRALKIAVRDKLLIANPASAVDDRPRVSKDAGAGAREKCWTAEEARKVLRAAQAAGPQVSAFFSLAIDSGARKSELLGLRWSDVDLDRAEITIARQLEPRSSVAPVWGPTKTDRARVVTLGTETIIRLRAHRKQQRELKMANRTTYVEHNLVFAKEPADLQTPKAALGQPCRALVGHTFRRIVKAAGVKEVSPHAMRHTAATLLLSAGVPVQVVAQRLGHAQVTQTLNTYAHATPNLQADAAARLGALLAEA
jgi:integrase